MRIGRIVGILGMMVGASAAHAAEPALAAADRFEKKIRPLLAARCWQCHGPEKSKGGLRLDTAEAIGAGGDSGPVVVPGKPGESRLIEAIGYSGELKMPPKGKLSEAEIAELTAWVRAGAVWPDATARSGTANDRRRRSAFHQRTKIVLGVPAATRPGPARRESDGLADVAARSLHPGGAREATGSRPPLRPTGGP